MKLVFTWCLVLVLCELTYSAAPRARLRHAPHEVGAASVCRAVSVMDAAADRAFLDWASDKCGDALSTNVELVTFSSGLRGLRAKQDLSARSPFLSWPAGYALQTTTGMRHPKGVDRDVWRSLDWYSQLACLLILEKKAGTTSDLAAWIQALPRDFDTPYGWRDADVAELHYPALEQAVSRQREAWARVRSQLEAGGVSCPQAEVEWALHCVRTRAFSGAYEGSTFQERVGLVVFAGLLTVLYPVIGAGTIEQSLTGAVAVLVFLVARDFGMPKVLDLKRYVLCPLIDMINHDSRVSSDVAYQVFSNAFSVTREEAVPAGEEVLISYGPRSNDQLLQYHGFVEPGSRFDVFVMPRFLEHIEAEVGVPDGALDAINTAGYSQAIRRGARLTHEGCPDELTLSMLRVLCAAGTSSPGGASARGGGDDKRELALLLAACRREAAALPTTRAADVEALATLEEAAGTRKLKEKEARTRTILAFRVEKKMLLDKAIAYLSAQTM